MAMQPSSSAVRALSLEYKSLQDEPVEGFCVKLLNEDNLFEWEVAIFGPPDTLYQGGYFKVSGTACRWLNPRLGCFCWGNVSRQSCRFPPNRFYYISDMTVIKRSCVLLRVQFQIWVPLYASDARKELHYPVYLDLGCSDIPEQQSNASTHCKVHGNRELVKTPKILQYFSGNLAHDQIFKIFGLDLRLCVFQWFWWLLRRK